MRIKQIILFSIFLNSQFCLSQSLKDTSESYWRGLIETNFETKNKDTLKLILSEWASSSSPMNLDSLVGQKDFIIEVYELFPEFVEVVFREFCGKLQVQFKPNDIYYHLPASITILFSNKELPKDLIKYQSEFSGIPIDSLKKYSNPMVKEMTKYYFTKDFLSFTPDHHNIILNGFRPYMKDSTFKVTYNDQSFFSKEIEEKFSPYYIEKFLEKKGYSHSEMKLSGTWAPNKLQVEYQKRNEHLSTFRLDLTKFIKKVVFYDDFESAIVEINANFDSCCPTFYLIFKKEDDNWVFNRHFSPNPRQTCMDFRGNCDFK
ncbi:MAG: hypothetical protein WEA99_02620 [Brumimicrobium sp.]